MHGQPSPDDVSDNLGGIKLKGLRPVPSVEAVELDELTPVDELVKHSSSAVDIRTVLMQVSTGVVLSCLSAAVCVCI
jgi:hypothetical protein